VLALGVSWMLDGLEVTLVGSLGAVLQREDTLGLSATEIGLAGSSYIAGAVLGALYFGRLADRLGRKRIFLVTMAVYLAGTVMSAVSVDFWTFAAFRFVTGFGIGGEYGAINSAIDELVPARAPPCRPRDQRQRLAPARRQRRPEPRASRPARARAAARLARRVRARRGDRRRDRAGAAARAGEPALAADPRSCRPRRGRGRRDRGAGARPRRAGGSAVASRRARKLACASSRYCPAAIARCSSSAIAAGRSSAWC
jgi:hypothetical protein